MLITGPGLVAEQLQAGSGDVIPAAPRLVLSGERGGKGWGSQGCWDAVSPPRLLPYGQSTRRRRGADSLPAQKYPLLGGFPQLACGRDVLGRETPRSQGRGGTRWGETARGGVSGGGRRDERAQPSWLSGRAHCCARQAPPEHTWPPQDAALQPRFWGIQQGKTPLKKSQQMVSDQCTEFSPASAEPHRSVHHLPLLHCLCPARRKY